MQMIFSNDWPTAARTAVRLLSPVQIWRIQHKVFFHLGTEPHCKMFFFKKSRFQIKGAFLENKTWAYMTMCFAVFHFDSMLCWRVVFHPPLISDSHKVPSSRTQPLRLLQLTQAGAVYSLHTRLHTFLKDHNCLTESPAWASINTCRRCFSFWYYQWSSDNTLSRV